MADYEATTFSIFYNNALFLAIVIFTSFYILKSFTPTVYPFLPNTTNNNIVFNINKQYVKVIKFINLIGENIKKFIIESIFVLQLSLEQDDVG